MNNYQLIKNTEWKEVEINGEVTEIPVNWDVNSFKNFSFICRGGSPRPIQEFLTEKKTGTPWIKISDATKVVKYIDSTEQYIIKEGESKSRLVYPGDLIVSNSASPGIPRFLNIKACIHDGWLLLRDFNGVDKEFLFHLIGMVREKLKSQGSGSIFTNLSIDILNGFECLIPPISQQSSIASILSAQESIIQDIESLISKYESRFQYLSEELLSGKLRVKEVDGQTVFYKNTEWKEVEINGEMKEIPSDWEVDTPKKLKFNITTGKKDANAATKNGKYPFFTCSENKILNIDTYCFDTEALLISGNGSPGEVKYYKGKFDAYQRTYILDNIKNIDFIFFNFKHNFKKSLNIVGGSIPFIKIGDLENFEMALPNEKEQKLIANLLTQQAELMNQQKELITKEKKKFDWLLNNLLSGKYLIKETTMQLTKQDLDSFSKFNQLLDFINEQTSGRLNEKQFNGLYICIKNSLKDIGGKPIQQITLKVNHYMVNEWIINITPINGIAFNLIQFNKTTGLLSTC